jgi:diguanylate cyclase
MSWFNRSHHKKQRSASKQSIFAWALLISALASAIGMPEPLEDIYRGARNYLRARPADQSVVVVAIDDKTATALGGTRYSRGFNAQLLDRLFQQGAKRVYFDEAFSQAQDAKGDQAFVQALSRHQGKVFVGAMHYYNNSTGQKETILPAKEFQSTAVIRSLNGASTPFSLSAEVYFGNTFQQRYTPSIAADISGVHGADDQMFRPDWSIQVRTIPTLSMIDVLNGSSSGSTVQGKDILVGVTTRLEQDFLQVAGQDWFPGIYVHAVGAQTLREGRPISIGWIPALVAAAIFSALLLSARTSRSVAAVAVAATAFGLAAPVILDMHFVTADFLSAYLMFGIVVYRATTSRHLLEAGLRNAGTLMPNLSALRAEPLAASRSIIAMRIRNYSAICASFATLIEDELITEIARRLTLPGDDTTFYQAEDALYWLGPSLSNADLEGHLVGLARLLETKFMIQGRKIDIQVAFGIESDFTRPIANRIGRALLAADNAAEKHQLLCFSANVDDLESAWVLSMMSELDDAIDAGDIWIAYQPQFDLRSGRITGAEALVRWQHPVRGAISPEAFIGYAEIHNRIYRLTFHVLEEAVLATKPIIATHPNFRLSVNASATILEHPSFVATINEVLARTGFPAANLTLEVTESAPFSEHQIIARNLAELTAAGIEISIDDYGTGNATLEYLRTVPCQEIKIDRRFVSGLTKNQSDRLLVESTIELAHGLGRRVIAEGIEDAETLKMLRDIRCDIAQGYFLAKPMRIAALATALANNSASRAA